MSFCCPQCSFTAQFASALAMHRQLEHGATDNELNSSFEKPNNMPKTTSMTLPRLSVKNSDIYKHDTKIAAKGLSRSNSATRLLERLRSRICKSKMGLFVHQEESTVNLDNGNKEGGTILQSSSKLFSYDSPRKTKETANENYRCHLCQFVADRITVLDRHLLNDHKIGLEALLKLVMAKTKEGVSDSFEDNMYDTYYKSQETEEGDDIVVQTVSPSIRILKHASTNTILKWTDIPDYKMDCKAITQELEDLMSVPLNEGNRDELFMKMQRLNEIMCKFMESSSVLKRVLKKESRSTVDSKKNNSINDDLFNLGIGDQDSRRDWPECNRSIIDKRESQSRNDKSKSATYNNYCY